jgi:hypothetical protein
MDPRTIGMIGFFVLVVWLPTITLAAVYQFRRLRLEERLKAIEHGRHVIFDPEVSAARTRRAGILLVAAGVGIALGDLILTAVFDDPKLMGFLGLAAVPLLIGLGLLVDHQMQLRDLRRRTTGRSVEGSNQ